MFYSLLRNILFTLSPERAHTVALYSLELAQKCGLYRAPQVQGAYTFGTFKVPNRVGLAAGVDKNAEHISALARLGFGLIEIGTVTPLPQPGNPKPRSFRIPQKKVLINRMGFNNHGLTTVLANVEKALQDWQNRSWLMGINIGKNAVTPIERALDDYLWGLQKAYSYADYITVNISSPNTKGLRDLQSEKYLYQLLHRLVQEATTLAQAYSRKIPLLVKIAPDVTDETLYIMLDSIMKSGIDGIIATNTTLDHSSVAGLRYGNEAGGLSGAPLTKRALDLVVKIRERVGPHYILVASGGIMSAHDAQQRIAAGADFVQLYTGLVYHGPRLVKDVITATATLP